MITTNPAIKAGDTYEDCAHQGRMLRVVRLETQVIDHGPDQKIYREVAVCEVLTRPDRQPSALVGYLVRISLSRLQSTAHYRPKGDPS